jgi:formylglycine-generating enzyme required for sulfatase activity
MKRYPEGGADMVFDDVDDFLIFEDSRAMRGSAYYNDKVRVRSASREGHEPGTRWTHLGFRPARTFR